jgi:hypothetical protein
MAAPRKLCYVFNARGPRRFTAIGTTSFASAPWQPLMAVQLADVGSPSGTDTLLCVLHVRFGNVDLSGLLGAGTRAAQIEIRPTWPHFQSLANGRWMLREGDWSIPPMVGEQQDNAITYCAVWRQGVQPLSAGQPVIQVATRIGAQPGFSFDLPISVEIEDVTLTVWNLAALDAEGIEHGEFWTLSPITLTESSASLASHAIPVPGSGTATYLTYGCAAYEAGSPHDPTTFRQQFSGVTKATGTWGTHARADVPTASNPMRHVHAGANVLEVPSTAGAVTQDLRGLDTFAPSATAKASIVRYAFVGYVRIDDLDPVWYEAAAPDIGTVPAKRLYAPVHGTSANQQDPATALHVPEIGQERVAMGWSVPLNEHLPELSIGFAGSVKLNGALQLAANEQPQLYVLQTDRKDRMPDYQTAPYRAGSAGYQISHEGQINPLDDPIDVLQQPTRITQQRRFFAGPHLVLAFDAAIGGLAKRQDQDAVGPTVYLLQDGESLSPANLPRLRHQPSGVLSGRRLNRSAKILTFDGRPITWGAFLQPRDTWTLRWRTRIGSAQAEIPRRDEVLADILGLDDGAFALEHPLTDTLTAFVVNGSSLSYESVGGGIWSVQVEVVELVWFGGGP